MPLLYTAIATAFADPILVNRIKCALIDCALNVISEPTNTLDHVNRDLWARRVIHDPGRAVETHGVAILIGSNLDGTATDAAIKSGVAAIIPAYIGF